MRQSFEGRAKNSVAPVIIIRLGGAQLILLFPNLLYPSSYMGPRMLALRVQSKDEESKDEDIKKNFTEMADPVVQGHRSIDIKNERRKDHGPQRSYCREKTWKKSWTVGEED